MASGDQAYEAVTAPPLLPQQTFEINHEFLCRMHPPAFITNMYPPAAEFDLKGVCRVAQLNKE